MVILLIEDEALVALDLAAHLAAAGHRVLGPASTIAAAIRLAERATPEPALVNIDLKCGDSGVEAARLLRDRWRIPSLFISGAIEEARAHPDVALGFLGKPCAPEIVRQSVEVARQLIDGRTPAAIPPALELFRSGDVMRNGDAGLAKPIPPLKSA